MKSSRYWILQIILYIILQNEDIITRAKAEELLSNDGELCEDDPEKEAYCSLMQKHIMLGEPNKCNYEMKGSQISETFLGIRDCKKTCGSCTQVFASNEGIESNDVLNNGLSLVDISELLPDVPSFSPTVLPSSSPSIIPSISSLPSSIPSTTPSSMPSAYPTELSSSTPTITSSLIPTAYTSSTKPTFASCKEKPEDKQFCDMMARLLLRGKNRCNKLYHDSETKVTRQGSLSCPIICGTCFSGDGDELAVAYMKVRQPSLSPSGMHPSISPSVAPTIKFSSDPTNIPSDLTMIPTNGSSPTNTPSTDVPTVRPTKSLSNVPSSAFVSSVSPTRCDHHEILAADKVTLNKGDYICSHNGRFTFGLRGNGNLEIIDIFSPSQPIWSSNTADYEDVKYLTFKRNGNLNLYTIYDEKIWTTNTYNAEKLYLTNFGEVVIGDKKGNLLWSTKSQVAYGCSGFQTLLRGEMLTPGRFICSSDSIFKFGLDIYGDVALWKNKMKIWSTDTGSGLIVNEDDYAVIFHQSGSLTLWDWDEILWEFEPEDDDDVDNLHLIITDGDVLIRDVSGDNDALWTASSSMKCTRILKTGKRLYNGQFICSSSHKFKFGLKDGNLCLLYNGQTLWTRGSNSGYYVEIQKDDGAFYCIAFSMQSVLM